MATDATGSTWYWGICSQEFVGDFIERSANGTFLVFKSPGNEDLTLMYRLNGNTKSVNIYHRDELYGFEEPLGFLTLDEALDAHNMLPTDTRNTLIHPAVKPGAKVKKKDEKDEELDSLAKQNELLDQTGDPKNDG